MNRITATLLAGAMSLSLVACSGSSSSAATSTDSSKAENVSVNDQGLLKDNTFTISMECQYAPYNWTQTDDSNGAVKIQGSSDYANGYDVMIAKKIAEKYGWDLNIIRSDWDSLVPSVQTGKIDAAIAGQSMTAERSKMVDFAGPYYYASFAILVKKNSDLVNAKSINDFGGKTGTAQIATIWYDKCLPQMKDAKIATGAVQAYDDLTMLDFTGTDGDFQFSDQERQENVNIGVSVRKGNTVLKDEINAVLDTMTEDDFNKLMDEAISIQPVGE